MSNKKQRNSLRYRLHSAIRKQGFELNTKDRTISFPCDKEMPYSKHLNRLINEFGYAIQLSIC